jgi:hypothetical protein
MKKARVIAFYLPQFHPFKENDEWWGKGFTEWTNVGKAVKLFRNHYQPRVPADLGYYDLRLPIVREEQACMAREAGIEGFCYWHYWFGNGKTLLSEIFKDVLISGKPDFPFCLGWANHSWSRRTWNSSAQRHKDVDLMIQEYPGQEDIIRHFHDVLPAFLDKRYIRVDDKPLFVVYEPESIPDFKAFKEIWNSLAKQEGLTGIQFVGFLKDKIKNYRKPIELGFDAVAHCNQWHAEYKASKGYVSVVLKTLINQILPEGIRPVVKYDYKKLYKNLITEVDKEDDIYPVIVPQWDRSPRAGKNGVIYYNSTPDLFKLHVADAVKAVQDKDIEHRIIFLRSWNEWAEGNYVEPDLKYGHGYLDALKDNLK